jgi:hypothetical protein
VTGKLTGTYTGNPDGSNTVNLALDTGQSLTAAMALTDGGTALQLLVTGGSLLGQGRVITGTGRVLSAPGTMPAGSYSFLLHRWQDASHEPQGILGGFNSDGAGNATGSITAVGPDIGPAPLNSKFTGTYSVNPDGTGSVTLNLDLGITVTLAIVATDGGSGILMLQTDASNGFNELFSGTARLQ